MKPFEIGERVAWTIRDHGKDKRIKGLFNGSVGGVAHVDVNGKVMTTVLARLNRCRGRKPGKPVQTEGGR
jgi:hypothetical protein